MARRRIPEAERLRRHNAEMKLALAENITVLEARRRLAARRWQEFEAAMERRRRCGTAAPAAAEPRVADLPDVPPPAAHQGRFWWQDDRF